MNSPEPSGLDGELAWQPDDEAAERAGQATEHFAAIPSELWDILEPPAPDEAAWASVRRGIAAGLAARRRARSRSRRLLIAAAALPLAVLAAWLAGTSEKPPVAESRLVPTLAVAPAPLAEDDPLAVYAVLPMVDGDDVAIESVRGYIPAGALTADDAPEELALAGPNDVVLVSVRAEPGATPIAKLSANPGDAPMIYAAKPPAR
jgi:hypothetical protein